MNIYKYLLFAIDLKLTETPVSRENGRATTTPPMYNEIRQEKLISL
jgi:hypothetical protein